MNRVLYLYRKNTLLCLFSPYHTSYLITKYVGYFSTRQAILWVGVYVCVCVCLCVCVHECTCSVTQSSLTLCDPRDCSPLGSSVLGVFQVRTLVWVAIISSRGSSRPRNWTHISCIAGGFFTAETPGKRVSQSWIQFWHWLHGAGIRSRKWRLSPHFRYQLQVSGCHLLFWHTNCKLGFTVTESNPFLGVIIC